MRGILISLIATFSISIFGASQLLAEYSIGLFFDEGASVSCVQDGLNTPLTGYIVAYGIDDEIGVSGWELAVSADPGLMVYPESVLSGLNIGIFPEFLVGIGENTAVVSDGIQILAAIGVYATSPGGIFLHAVGDPTIPGSGSAIYTLGNNAGAVHEFVHDLGTPAATIGDTLCSATVESLGEGNVVSSGSLIADISSWALTTRDFVNANTQEISYESVGSYLQDASFVIYGQVISRGEETNLYTVIGSDAIRRMCVPASIEVEESFISSNLEVVDLIFVDTNMFPQADGNAVLPDVGDMVFCKVNIIDGIATVFHGGLAYSSGNDYDWHNFSLGAMLATAREISDMVSIQEQFDQSDLVVVCSLDHNCGHVCHNAHRVHSVELTLKGPIVNEVFISGHCSPGAGESPSVLFPHAKGNVSYVYFLKSCHDGTYSFVENIYSACELRSGAVISYTGAVMCSYSDLLTLGASHD